MNFGKLKALIIDDEKSIHGVVEGVLQGFDCEHALTLAVGLAICETSKPDLIVLDLHLEGEALGFDGLRKIRERFPRIPIVIFTANDNDADALYAMQNGAQAYITKSHDLNIKVFYREVIHAIARHRSFQSLLDRNIECERKNAEFEKRLQAIETELQQVKEHRWKFRAGIITGIVGILTALAAFAEKIVALFRKQ
jgi:DNA-binding response OmpR family regulator